MKKEEMQEKFLKDKVNFLFGSKRLYWESLENGGYDWRERGNGLDKWGSLFFKIRDIQLLKESRRIEDFDLARYHRPLKANLNYAIVLDKGYI